MTRQQIIFQILSEASARPVDQVQDLFDSLKRDGIFSGRGMEVDFPAVEAGKMLEEFRGELGRIREVLLAKGLL